MSRAPTLWGSTEQLPQEAEQLSPVGLFPNVKYQHEFSGDAPVRFTEATCALPPLERLERAVDQGAKFDLFVGAMGFEERTLGAAAALVKQDVKVSRAFMLEFDMYYKATE